MRSSLAKFKGIGGYYLWYGINSGEHYTGSGTCLVNRLATYFGKY